MKNFKIFLKTVSTLISIVLLIITYAVGGIAAAQNQDFVYNDTIAEQWANGTWPCGISGSPAYNITQSDVVYSGNYAIDVNHSSPSCQGGWGAFDLDRRSQFWTNLYWMYPNQYQNLSFSFNPGNNLDNLDYLVLTADNGYSVKIKDYINGTVNPDAWYRINISLDDINKGNRFFRLVFWFTSSGTIHYYLDDISLEWVDDPDPPLVYNLSVTNITWKSATVKWQADEYTKSTLGFGKDAINSFVEEQEFSKNHKIVLDNLTADTHYNFSIISRDHQVNASQNTAQNQGEFTTAPPDVVSPMISNVTAADIRSDRATISWVTDEPSDSRVYYGENNYSLNKTDYSLTTSHRVVIAGLKTQNYYQYRIVSLDESGNQAAYEENPPMNFTTTTYPKARLEVYITNKTHPFSRNILGAGLGNWAFYWGRPYPNDSLKLRELTRLIKPGVLRYAGGLASNSVTWDRNNTQYYAAGYYDTDGDGLLDAWKQRTYYNEGDPLTAGYDRCSGPAPITIENAYSKGYQKDEIDALAAFAQYVGADVMIEADITTCDPDLWADMLRYTNVEHDYNFKYWELGNELDLEKIGGKSVPFGPEYVSRYKKYYNALKDVDTNVLVTGPTTAAHDNDTFWRAYLDFIDPLTLDPEIQANKSLDVLSYHYYPLWNHNGGEKSYEDMFDFSSREHIDSCVKEKRELLDNRELNNTRIAVTEFNSMAADLPTSYTFNHANALYMADTLARQANSGADIVMHWELYDQPISPSGDLDTSYGLLNSNGSSISIGYSTREITIEDRFYPTPVYYTYFMYAQFFGDMLVNSSSSMEDKLSIWASTDSDQPDTLKLMVVNLADEPVEANLSLNGLNSSGGKYYEMTNQEFVAAADKAKVWGGTSINGLEIDSTSAQSIIDSARNITDSGRPVDNPGDSFKHVYPAFSATIITLYTDALPAVRYINGTVIDSINKTAIPGVTLFTNYSHLTTTDEYGFYSFAVGGGTYEVTARFDPEYYMNSTMVSTISSAVIVNDIELIKKPSGTISGVVNS